MGAIGTRTGCDLNARELNERRIDDRRAEQGMVDSIPRGAAAQDAFLDCQDGETAGPSQAAGLDIHPSPTETAPSWPGQLTLFVARIPTVEDLSGGVCRV